VLLEDISRDMGIPYRTLKRVISALRDAGFVIERERTPDTKWGYYLARVDPGFLEKLGLA
jgi:transcription initiation factor IIE alpha subunit